MKVRITRTRSSIGCKDKQIATLRHLGLRKIHQTVEREDSEELRGMINRVSYGESRVRIVF